MSKKIRLILISLVVFLLSLQGIAQGRYSLPIMVDGEITPKDAFVPYEFTLTEDAFVSIEMMASGEASLDPMVVLLDKNGIIIAEGRVDGDGAVSGLSIPLAEGDYTVIAGRNDRSGASTGTFNLSVVIEDTRNSERFALSNEQLEAMGYPPVEIQERANWTILAYYGADSNLEEDIVRDFDEFEQAGGSDVDVRVLVLLDRNPDYSTVDGDWAGTRLYEVQNDSLSDTIINSTPLMRFDELDMGDPQTLSAFLVWGVRSYPAEHYVVSFGSHGAGWRGIVTDESNGNSSLSLNDLRWAFDTVQSETGVEQFDLLVNDACLMASIEYYDVMQDYFHFSIGSAELVTNPALDMNTLTLALRESLTLPDFSLREVGRQLVDLYINRDSVANSPVRNFTSAMTDLSAFQTFEARLNEFASVVNADPQRYVPTLTRARANTYTYNRLFGASEQIDPGDFMEQVILVSSDFETLIPAAEAVIASLDDVNVYGNAGDFAIGRTSYYNIFFPLSSGQLNDYFLQSGLNDWSQMLMNYFAYSRYDVWQDDSDSIPFHEPQAPLINIREMIPQYPIATFNLPLAINIEVQASNVARGTFYAEQILDEQTSLRLLTSPLFDEVEVPYDVRPLRNQNVWRSGVDQRTVSWNAGGYEIIGENGRHIEFLQKSFDESDAFFLEGRYRPTPDAEWFDVKVTFTFDSSYEFALRSASFISVNREAGTFGVFEPEPGSQLQVYRIEVDLEDGDIDIEDDGNIYTIGENGLGANLVPLETGDYILRFQLEAFGQDIVEDTMFVRVENDAINPNMRGQNLINEFGFVGNIPVWWVGNFAEQPGYISTDTIINPPHDDNPYRTPIFIRIYYYLGLSNLNEARERVVNVLGRPDHPIIFSNDSVIDGRRLLEFSYTLDNRYIRAFATYDAQRDMAMVFMIDDPAVNPDLANQLFDDFVNTLGFYDNTISCESTRWCMTELSREQTLVLPSDWIRGIVSGTRWAQYHSPFDINLGVAFTRIDDVAFDLVAYAGETIEGIDTGDNSLRNYAGEHHDWESIQYTINHNGVAYIGRLYRTVENGASYIVRLEAPEAEAVSSYVSIMHPLIDSILIEDLYYEYDWLDTVGLRFEVPNPVLDDNPYLPVRQSSVTGTQIARISSPFGDEELEIFFIPGESLDNATFWFGDYWDSLNHHWSISDFVPVEIGGQEAVEFNYTLTIDGFNWSGRYFAVHNPVDDVLYIIGGREMEFSGRDVEGAYEHLRDTIEFEFGDFDFYTSITNRPLFDEQYAIDVDVWQFSEPMQATRNMYPQVDRLELMDDQFAIELYFIQNLSDDPVDDLQRLPVFAESESYEISYKQMQAFELIGLRGRFLAVYDESRGRIVVVGVERLVEGADYEPIFERLYDSLEIIPFD